MSAPTQEEELSKYLFIFRGGAFATPGLSPSDLQAHLEKWGAWIGSFQANETFLGGDPLENSGRSLRGVDRQVTDGPYAESKDLVTGNLLIEASSINDATEMARGCPIFEFDGSVEVRPVADHSS